MMDYPLSARVIQFPNMPKLLTRPVFNRLREIRKARKISQRIVAEAVGTSEPQMSRLEIGHRDMDIYWLRRCAAFFEMLPADLLLLEDGGLTEQERHLINTIREIPKQDREAFWRLASAYQELRSAGELVELTKLG